MAQRSSIEWTEATWNPVTGCTKVSPGCKNCYAERLATRLKAIGLQKYEKGFQVNVHPDTLDAPLHWKKSRMVFVNSMSDLFHRSIPTGFVVQVFSVMERLSQHTFQVLTKRPEVALELAGRLSWPENVWLGVSVENASYTHRIRTLQRIPAKVRFLSLEPLLGQIPRLPLRGIHWVIVGGESGPKARPMDHHWVTQIRDRSLAADVPFFFKQWGGVNKKKTGRVMEGRTWDGLPVVNGHRDPEYAETATA